MSTRKSRDRAKITRAPKTSIANDGKTKLYAYEVRALIYAPNLREARRRLGAIGYPDLDEVVLWGRR
jgi:hypothetical protein